MVTVQTLRKVLLALPGAVEEPHFDRRAFKAGKGARRRTILTLAPDEASVNFMFTPEEQAWKMAAAPALFAPVPGGWGRMGITTATLDALTEADLTAAVDMIHRRLTAPKPARPKPAQPKRTAQKPTGPKPTGSKPTGSIPGRKP